MSGIRRTRRALRTVAVASALAIGGSVLLTGTAVGTVAGSGPVHPAETDNDVRWDGLFHDQGSLFADPVRPGCSDPVQLRFRAYANDVTEVALSYWDTADSARHRVPAESDGNDATGRYEFWRVTLPAGNDCGTKYYRFEVTDGTDTDWYNAGGVYDEQPTELDFAVVPGFDTPSWAQDSVLYQIFPDRFANGEPSNDITDDQYRYFDAPTEAKQWGESVAPIPPAVNSSVFFGGDLIGVRQRLDYLTETLGVNALYLNPVFTSPTNHAYDTQDYFAVDPRLGGDRALADLVSSMHDAGGAVILDGVFNHAGSWVQWFDRGNVWPGADGAYESADSPYADWFTFRDWPEDYVSFLDQTPSMPKFDFGVSGSQLRERLYGASDSVAQHWIREFGIDGWRLDAPQYADAGGGGGENATNHEIWAEFRDAVKAADPDSYIVGEYWGVATPWLGGEEWDGAVNFNGFTDPVSRWLTGRNHQNQPAALSVSELDGWLRGTRADNPRQAQLAMSNHLSNHDIPRFATRAGGDEAPIRLAHILQLTYVGIPTIYYGDEYGMTGGADPENRRTFDWSRTEDDLVGLVSELIALRERHSALRTGSFVTLGVADDAGIYAYGRMDEQSRIAVVLNNGDASREYAVDVHRMSVTDGTTMTDALSGREFDVTDGQVRVPIAPGEGLILVDQS